jgi:centrin-3
MLQVAMRALGFESKKSEVLDILRENERGDPGFISYDAFLRVSTWCCIWVLKRK